MADPKPTTYTQFYASPTQSRFKSWHVYTNVDSYSAFDASIHGPEISQTHAKAAADGLNQFYKRGELPSITAEKLDKLTAAAEAAAEAVAELARMMAAVPRSIRFDLRDKILELQKAIDASK